MNRLSANQIKEFIPYFNQYTINSNTQPKVSKYAPSYLVKPTLKTEGLVFDGIGVSRPVDKYYINLKTRRYPENSLRIIQLITYCAKLLKFDWLKAVQLIHNCTAENNTECVQKL